MQVSSRRSSSHIETALVSKVWNISEQITLYILLALCTNFCYSSLGGCIVDAKHQAAARPDTLLFIAWRLHRRCKASNRCSSRYIETVSVSKAWNISEQITLYHTSCLLFSSTSAIHRFVIASLSAETLSTL